eukprot:4982454-Prymnesium_polylepis.1
MVCCACARFTHAVARGMSHVLYPRLHRDFIVISSRLSLCLPCVRIHCRHNDVTIRDITESDCSPVTA